MNNLPEPTESPPEADLEQIEDGLEEFRFEEWLEQKLFELDERHRRLEIKGTPENKISKFIQVQGKYRQTN
ncbi:MAG: hypothetical protein WBG70_08870 [Spirulinaceae cyanobacterium]